MLLTVRVISTREQQRAKLIAALREEQGIPQAPLQVPEPYPVGLLHPDAHLLRTHARNLSYYTPLSRDENRTVP
eukprot:5455606-Pyramimonas_sp.AAC.2